MDAFTRADDATTLPAQQQLRCVLSSGGSVYTRTTRSYKSGGARHGGRAFFFSSSWVYGLVVVRFNRCGLGFVQHFGENGVRLGERVRAGLLGWRSGL